MPISAPKLLIFDSGIGGLSIAREIRVKLPDCQITYVADNRHFPYGLLSEEALIERVTHLFPWLLSQYQPAIIVIACNSASTLVLDRLRTLDSRPIIGVVPAIKPAAQLSQSGHIGLLATPGTVQRAYTDTLIQTFAPHCRMTKVGSNELVAEAERKLRGEPVNPDMIARILAPIQSSDSLDTLVLGCTHFPFLREEISACLGNTVQLIDSGEAIARRVEHVCEQLQPRSGCQPASLYPRQPDSFLYTSSQAVPDALAHFLRALGFGHIACIER
jgi:glutamate racemase